MECALTEIFASSSSSSSSDDEFFELDEILFAREEKHQMKKFIEDVVHKYSDEVFRKNFRVSRSTANNIINQYKNSRHYMTKINGGRKAISAESQILAFLWFAGNKDSYREVANLFNITESSIYKRLGCVLEFLFDISTQYIKFPTTVAEKIEISRAFTRIAGFQNVLGCIDGSYIYIKKPAHKIRSTYVNRHGLISITLQGICDADKKFTDVFIASPSKIHDSRIFTLSFISKDLPALCGPQYHILGDAAYPLREYLLTPYKDYGNLTIQKKKYNKKHSQTRVKIKNCFGLLKQRFRQLVRLDFFTVEKMCKFVLGCCVIHNLCIIEGDLWEEAEYLDDAEPEEQINSEEETLTEAVLRHLGELKRNNIADMF